MNGYVDDRKRALIDISIRNQFDGAFRQVMSAIVERARNSGYADVNEYISQFVLRLSERQSEVEALAIEGLHSGPSEPWDKNEIEGIRADLKSKHGS